MRYRIWMVSEALYGAIYWVVYYSLLFPLSCVYCSWMGTKIGRILTDKLFNPCISFICTSCFQHWSAIPVVISRLCWVSTPLIMLLMSFAELVNRLWGLSGRLLNIVFLLIQILVNSNFLHGQRHCLFLAHVENVFWWLFLVTKEFLYDRSS